MNINKAKTVGKYFMRAGVPLAIVGTHGQGKTSAVMQIFKEEKARREGLEMESVTALDGKKMSDSQDGDGFNFWSVSAPNLTIEELVGMPNVYTDLNGEDKVQYLRMSGLLPPSDHKGGGIWLVDELNRSLVEIEKAFMQILLEGRYLDYTLPDDVWRVTTMNPPGGDYMVRDMDPATMDRMAVITMEPSIDEWSEWAVGNIFNPLAEYVSETDNVFDTNRPKVNVSSTGRSFHLLSNVINLMSEKEILSDGFLVCSALIGEEHATGVMRKINEHRDQKPVSPEDIMDKYGYDMETGKVGKGKTRRSVQKLVHRSDARIDLLTITLNRLSSAIDSLGDDISEKHMRNIVSFLIDIPSDMAMDFLEKDDVYRVSVFIGKKVSIARTSESNDICADLVGKIYGIKTGGVQ